MNDHVTEGNDRGQEMMWFGMAEAIVGSGSYVLRGEEGSQIPLLVDWMREGADRGYDWQGAYRRIYDSWANSRALPSPTDMQALVTQWQPLSSLRRGAGEQGRLLGKREGRS
jgi:hypothetical protein